MVYGCSLGRRFLNAAQDIRPVYTEADTAAPEIKGVYDVLADSKDDVLTPNGLLELYGQDLKIYTHEPGQGVFFIDQSNNNATPALRLHNNEPSKLSVIVPALAAGTYRVEVRNTTRKGKEMRMDTYPVDLTVS